MKPRIKAVNMLINVKEDTDPIKLANNIQKIIKELEKRDIIRSFTKAGVTIDYEGRGEE